ncbi:acyltransferase family protein [soil metagenome]
MSSPKTGEYRPDIEGLRGVAILSVALYHFKQSMLPGGLVGVDIFFVISGFLITGILLREYAESRRINLANFWARRARRILPAATLVLLATAALTPLLVSPLLIKQVGRDILAAGYFGLNWRAAGRAVDYSAAGDDASPVLHYWSLAVEEQFYLAWPLILICLFFAARKAGVRPGLVVACAAGLALVASFGYCVYLTGANQPLAFFSTLSRAWQILTGALVAAAVSSGFRLGSGVAQVVGTLGLAAILVSFFIIDPQGAFPGWIAAVPVAGVAGLILAGATSTQNWGSRAVSIPPLNAIGRVSYVWYLWHWPFLFLGTALYPQGGSAYLAVLLVLSFAISVATHRLFENPVRFNARLVRSSARSLAMGAILVALGALVGFGVERYGLAQTVTLADGNRQRIEDILDDRSPVYRSDCHISQIETRHERCAFGAPGTKPEIVLFGDSHAAHWFDAVEAAAIAGNTAFLMRSKSGCPAVDGAIWNAKLKRRYVECDTWHRSVLDTIAAERPKLVIISSATSYAMMDEETQAQAQAQEEARPKLYRKALHAMIARLLESAAKVVLIKDTPVLPEEPLLCLVRNPGHEELCTWPAVSVLSSDAYIPDLTDFGGRVEILDLNGEICPGGACHAVADGKVIFYDQSHITATFSRRLSATFMEVFRRNGL